MKKFLALSCLLSFGLITGYDSVESHLRLANQQLKECFEGGNQAKSDCFKTWQSLTNSIFAEELQNKYPGLAFQMQNINNEFMQAVERRFNQYNDTITASQRDGQNLNRRNNLDKVRQEFYRGLDVALAERKQALSNMSSYIATYPVEPSAPAWPGFKEEPEVVIVEVEKPYFPLLAWLFGRR